jgi:hypothetical protein
VIEMEGDTFRNPPRASGRSRNGLIMRTELFAARLLLRLIDAACEADHWNKGCIKCQCADVMLESRNDHLMYLSKIVERRPQ